MPKGKDSIGIIIALIVIIIAAIIAVILLDNHNKSATNQTASKQQIETNWKTFFAYSTSLSQREALLQNGSQFSQIIQSEFQALNSEKSSVTISGVDLTNPSTADVTYSVDINGTPVLANQKGEALLINNKWIVSDTTICGLLSLSGSKPAVCQTS